jgi:hypothetical protein
MFTNEKTWRTCIYCDVADNRSVVRKPNILSIMTTTIWTGSIGSSGLLVDNESTLDIDFHGTRMNDCAVYFGCVGEGPRSLDGCILRRGMAVSLRDNCRHDETQMLRRPGEPDSGDF